MITEQAQQNARPAKQHSLDTRRSRLFFLDRHEILIAQLWQRLGAIVATQRRERLAHALQTIIHSLDRRPDTAR